MLPGSGALLSGAAGAAGAAGSGEDAPGAAVAPPPPLFHSLAGSSVRRTLGAGASAAAGSVGLRLRGCATRECASARLGGQRGGSSSPCEAWLWLAWLQVSVRAEGSGRSAWCERSWCYVVVLQIL